MAQQSIKTLVVGISGVSNGGKTTLTERLAKEIPNSYHISQDAFFKEEVDILIDEATGYQRWDDLTALHSEDMMKCVEEWKARPETFCRNRTDQSQVYVLIIEGILIYNYRPLEPIFDLRYFLTLPFEEAKRRRGRRVYIPSDPPGMFDQYVWRMYLENKQELEDMKIDMVFMDGTTDPNQIYTKVKNDIFQHLKALEDNPS
ncbi:nicotinamide riboside kinase 1-like [Glandiceps talaboti]